MKKMAIAIAGLLQVLIYCCILLAATSFLVVGAVTSKQVLQRFEENPSPPIRKLDEEAVRFDMNALMEFKRYHQGPRWNTGRLE